MVLPGGDTRTGIGYQCPVNPQAMTEHVFVWSSGRREQRFAFVDSKDPTFATVDGVTFHRFKFTNGELDVWLREWIEYHEWNEDRQGRPDCPECRGTGTVAARFPGGSTQQACECRNRL